MQQTPAVDDALLTELERQDLYLAELPKDYPFPLFSGKQAVESQRRSGYKDSARAAREIIDNAYEAGAKNVWVTFDRPKKKAGAEKEAISSIAFIDNGPGMKPKMIQYALTWGGGTHFKNPRRIGKFGFGLPNSSINQTKRVEVYSKTVASDWHRAVLDIDEIDPFALVKIEDPQPVALPKFVTEYLERNNITLETGTVVVWVKPDRITYRTPVKLRELFVDDFGAVYRGLLDHFSINVEGTEVKKVDPLFVTPDALLYMPKEEGGAEVTFEKSLPVRFSIDPETGEKHLTLLDSEIELERARHEGSTTVGVIGVKIARFPYGFVEGKKRGTDAYRRFEIRKPRRGISFVRSNREIDTVDVFPKSSKAEATGLGQWPLMQSYAYHYATEITFGPELDEAYELGNEKQTLRPIEDFWRVLTTAKVDEALRREEQEQDKLRKKDDEKKAADKRSDPTAPTAATEAAAQVAALLGTGRIPDEHKDDARSAFEQAAKDRAAATGMNIEAVRDAIIAEQKRKEFAIDFFDSEGGVFFKPSFGNGMQRVAMINRAHPFYTSFYVHLLNSDDARTSNAVDLLLLMLAVAELEAPTARRDFYELEREGIWSRWLNAGLKILDRLQPRQREQNEQEATA